MNRAITQLFGLTILLFALLVAFTSRWTVFDAQSLKDEPANRRALIEEQQIPRGRILADDGTLLARSVGRGSGPRRVFVRRYPADNLFSHAIGYSFIGNGRVGLERSRNAPLTGDKNEFASVFDEFRNRQREGEDLRTNLDPKGQRTALQALSGRRGSVVAIEPQTGKVRVMASVPAYDPNQIPERQSQLNRADGSPLLNRATQTRYQPGSTFKVVTAAAALDSGRYTPTTSVDGSSPRTVSGVPLSNSGGENFGTISLTEALTNSVNTVWAQVGESIGRRTLEKYMGRFGFNQDPPLDYPDSQMAPSGIRNSKSRLLTGNDGFDVGRVAIGQGGQEGQIQVSPLQMAMVAAAVGNGGKLMKPRLTDRVVAQDGRVTKRINPQQQSRVMSGKSAGELGQMMASVVKEGTGTAAALNGIDVAGKTGTAEVENGQRNQVWFIAFAPVKNPRMAIAVTLESQPKGSQGGTVAAPVAKQVLQELLR